MKFSAADQAAMLSAIGDVVVISDDFLQPSYTTKGSFEQAGKLVQQYDGSVITTGPTVTLSEADAALVREDSIITIDAVDYVHTQKMPDGSGLVTMELTKDF